MNLAEALLPLVPGGTGSIAFVGAGGKTTAVFTLARELWQRGRTALVTTTTHMLDPRLGPPGAEGRLVFRAAMEGPYDGSEAWGPRGGPAILMSREAEAPEKVKGIHPSWMPALEKLWDFVVVEADGARRLPLKAPGGHEPVLPPGAGLVVGVLGLDGLGRPMDAASVHRPDRFEAVTGCEPGEPIRWDHLAALVRHPQGLFKDARGPRALLLNKADTVAERPSTAQMAELGLEGALLCSLREPEGVIVCLREGCAPWP